MADDWDFTPALDFVRRINEDVYEAVKFATPSVLPDEPQAPVPFALKFTPKSILRKLPFARNRSAHWMEALERTHRGEIADIPLGDLDAERARLEEDSVWTDRSTESLASAGIAVEEAEKICARSTSSQRPNRVLVDVLKSLRSNVPAIGAMPSQDGVKALRSVIEDLQSLSDLANESSLRAKAFANEHLLPILNHSSVEIQERITENSGNVFENTQRLERVEHAQRQLVGLGIAQETVTQLLRTVDVVTGVWKRALADEAGRDEANKIVGLNAQDPTELDAQLEDYIEQIADAARSDLGIRVFDENRSTRGRGDSGMHL